MIKVISGWSNRGGSTTAFINLVNLFNQHGIEAEFYGPHSWHVDKCKGKLINDIVLNKEDKIIYHFLNVFTARPPVDKFILSLHEKEMYNLKTKNYRIFDKIHYLNERQKNWHGVTHPHFYCPNPHEHLEISDRPNGKIAGIIGSIDENKNVHTSIKRALEAGNDKILLFGEKRQPYFDTLVLPLLSDKVEYIGYVEDKKKIYESITSVWSSSLSENASLVRDECDILGIPFFGNEETPKLNIMSNEEILNIWKRELDL